MKYAWIAATPWLFITLFFLVLLCKQLTERCS